MKENAVVLENEKDPKKQDEIVSLITKLRRPAKQAREIARIAKDLSFRRRCDNVVLRIGQKVPDFSLFDSEGHERKLSEFTQKGTVTVLFFPFAFSGVCDREMCTFRDGLVEARPQAGSVVGISIDSRFTLKVFAETYNLGFPLLSDFNKKVIKAFDVLQDPWVELGYRGVAEARGLRSRPQGDTTVPVGH